MTIKMSDVYEEVPNWKKIYGKLDRPEYALKNGKAINCYGLLKDVNDLQAENKLAYEESASNANWMYKKFYAHKPDDVGFELCDSASGIQTQIDNMLVGVYDEFQELQAENERLREALELADGFMRGLEHKFDIGYVGYPTQSKITEALKHNEVKPPVTEGE